MTDDKQNALDALKRKHEALASAMVILQKENDLLKGINTTLVLEKKQWLEQKEFQDKMIQQQLQLNDKIVRDLQDEIINIKNRNR